ncbi:HAMP domain-containing sensor histidine kinase [Anaerolentibacter hominis]|uniref:sensor histidine kinase n=1 Tax=Anaerolentibacter hominis TaxID=3079009 RepID=UPI0031B82040
MKLRERLMTAFLITMLFPILLLAVAGGLIYVLQNNSIEKHYDVNDGVTQVLYSPIRIFDKATKETFAQVQKTAAENPEKFEDMEYLTGLDQELNTCSSFLLVRKGNEIFYNGDASAYRTMEAELPDYSGPDSYEGSYYMSGEKAFLLKQQDFLFSDGSEGSLFLVTDVNTLLPQAKSFISQILFSIVLILCITALILTYWIYQGIFRPLSELWKATNEIQKGNLEYSIKAESNDEIGMLCRDFEKMRIRLKAMIDRQIQYQEDSRELVGNISHDLKTPLTAIKGYTEGIMDGIADTPQKQEKYLKTIYAKANDMTYLVDELADFTKIESDAMVYNFKELNVAEFFSDCINERSLDMEVKNIELCYYNEIPQDVTVMADGEQLKRVINNIFGNSLKYMDKKKGIINIRIKDQGDFVAIQIEDNGKGIAKDEVDHIFERFYRTDASRNSAKGGSGLGLSIAKKIIDDHGGKIYAKSGEGMGTAICFTLKKYGARGEKAEAEIPVPPPKKRIIRIPSNPFKNHERM